MYGMNDEYRLAIRGLQSEGAPARVEQNVLVAFRRRRASLKTRLATAAVLSAAVAAAACVAVVAGYRMYGPDIALIQAPLAHIAAPPLAAAARPVAPAPPMRLARAHRRLRKPAEEIATRFYTLPGAEGLPAPDAEAVVRVEVPRATLRLVGFPMNEDRRSEYVRADVVFGQDGMARAIRFVQ
jgi:hypothetical protein